MSRGAGAFGAVAVSAGLLALSGCAINYWPKAFEGSPPDGVDYVRATHCGGLLWAEDIAIYGPITSAWPQGAAKRYQRWAELNAWYAGKDPSLALRDMTALRDGFLLEAYKGSEGDTRQNLRAAYPGDLASCFSAWESMQRDIVVIGG